MILHIVQPGLAGLIFCHSFSFTGFLACKIACSDRQYSAFVSFAHKKLGSICQRGEAILFFVGHFLTPYFCVAYVTFSVTIFYVSLAKMSSIIFS